MSLRTQHDLGYRGTQPRAKTIRMLARQQHYLLPCIGKRVLTASNEVIHPTKGRKPNVGYRTSGA
jgi:hypothetical protein